MIKVGIVTIFDAVGNIGNKLQNYAVVKIYSKLGCECVTLATENPLSKKEILRKNIIHFARTIIKHQSRFNPYNYKRLKRFCDFNKHLYVDYSLLSGNPTKYDLYSVGSDQVWNPEFYKYDIRRQRFYLLDFVKDKKKISFSASFGISQFPNEWNDHFSSNLREFKALSVREEAGAKIIKELTGRDATILVDPTMLLTQEEWRKVSKKPRGAKEGYILTYFLSPKCDEAKTKLEAIREDKEVYELLNSNDKVAGTAGPSEFLWLFDHADIILTDSFHACVFSFLFNKPFIVYDRNWDGGNMNSRLETLLSKFSLERKYAGSGLPNNIWEHDYTEGYKQLEIERKKAIGFLKKALED